VGLEKLGLRLEVTRDPFEVLVQGREESWLNARFPIGVAAQKVPSSLNLTGRSKGMFANPTGILIAPVLGFWFSKPTIIFTKIKHKSTNVPEVHRNTVSYIF
jgi:hypothetical protein